MTDNVGLDAIAFRKLDIRPSASSPGGSCQHILSTETTYEANSNPTIYHTELFPSELIATMYMECHRI